MNSNRSSKSYIGLGGRSSPPIPSTRSDNLINRSSSPSSSIFNSRSQPYRQPDRSKAEFSSKDSNTIEDLKFHKAVFQRFTEKSPINAITKREKFIQALSYVGYDLPKTRINELWEEYSKEISFQNFQDILKAEKPIDTRALEEAFEKLYKDRKSDWSEVDFERLRIDLLEKGDRLTDDEFQKIRFVLGTEHGKVDIKKLTKTIGDNKISFRQKILKEQEEDAELSSKRVSSPRPSSRNHDNCNVRILIDSNARKIFNPPKTRALQMKGAFFCEYLESPEDAMYFSIGYTFEIKKNTPICIVLEPTLSRYHKDSSFKNLDVRIFLFEKNLRSKERRLLNISSGRSGTKSYLQMDELPKGHYEIVPVTFGGVLKPRSREISERPPTKKLRENKRGNFSMTKDYREALEYVFDLFDFDDNKQLDRQEYNLWTIRTTGEEITDADWEALRNAIGLDVDENVSKENFLKLNDFEVQEQDTTEHDLWTGLKSVGFNNALEIDMMCSFNLTAYVNQPDVTLKPTAYVELSEIKKILIKFLQNKGEKIKLDDPSVRCFNYQDDCGSVLYVENKRLSNARLSIDVKDSNNAALNLKPDPRKPIVINVRKDTTQLLWFAHKLDSQRDMELNAIVQIQ